MPYSANTLKIQDQALIGRPAGRAHNSGQTASAEALMTRLGDRMDIAKERPRYFLAASRWAFSSAIEMTGAPSATHALNPPSM
jgi:hypothetical protein